jgi:hypothetical protein
MTDTDVAIAREEAGTAAAKLAELTHRSLHEPPDRRPAAAQILEQEHLADFAARRVQVVQERAHKASAEQRLSDLAEVAAKVDALAGEAETATIRTAQLTAISETARDFRASCEAHDQAVRALAKWADSLNLVNIAGGHGPHPDNGEVQVLGPPPDGGIAHASTSVQSISKFADRALAEALDGKIDQALELVTAVKHRPAPRLDHTYEIIMSGEKFDRHGDPDRWLVERLVAGTVREVDPQ